MKNDCAVTLRYRYLKNSSIPIECPFSDSYPSKFPCNEITLNWPDVAGQQY
jgi:hypothetical protein